MNERPDPAYPPYGGYLDTGPRGEDVEMTHVTPGSLGGEWRHRSI